MLEGHMIDQPPGHVTSLRYVIVKLRDYVINCLATFLVSLRLSGDLAGASRKA